MTAERGNRHSAISNRQLSPRRALRPYMEAVVAYLSHYCLSCERLTTNGGYCRGRRYEPDELAQVEPTCHSSIRAALDELIEADLASGNTTTHVVGYMIGTPKGTVVSPATVARPSGNGRQTAPSALPPVGGAVSRSDSNSSHARNLASA